MIGAVLRGMDLVALGNYSGNATKLGSDATMALIAREGSGIKQGRPCEPQGQEDRRLLRHHQPPLHPRAAREGGAHARRRDARQHAAAGHDGGAAVQGHRRLLGLGSLADRRAQGRARRGRGHPRRRRDLLSRLQRRACGPGSRRTARRSRNSSPRSPKPTSGCARTRSRRRRSRRAGSRASRPTSPRRRCSSTSSRPTGASRPTTTARCGAPQDRLQPARHHQVDLRRQQAHRAEAHPQRDAGAARTCSPTCRRSRPTWRSGRDTRSSLRL